MAEVLRVILSSFWTWLGTFLIVCAIAEGIGGIFRFHVMLGRADRRSDPPDEGEDD
jgi:hypothetical protein